LAFSLRFVGLRYRLTLLRNGPPASLGRKANVCALLGRFPALAR
jgi:hypothetical protein